MSVTQEKITTKVEQKKGDTKESRKKRYKK